MDVFVKTFVNRKIFASNLYIVSSDLWNLLIDPSFYDDEIEKYLEWIWWLDAVLITHWHGDHIRNTDSYIQKYPNAKIYVHELEQELLKNIELNCSLRVWSEKIIINSDYEAIKEWNLKIWWYDIQVFLFQWHTNGSVMYYFPHQKIMFLWDTIMADCIWRRDLPTWNFNLVRQSIQKFKNLDVFGDTICYPWHWESVLFSDILAKNNYLL